MGHRQFPGNRPRLPGAAAAVNRSSARRAGAATLALLLIPGCGRPGAPGPVSGPLRAGAAVRVITPRVEGAQPPPRVAGYGAGTDATGVLDDLYARALVLEAGSGSVAIVALDLIGLFHDDVVLIREAVRRSPGGAPGDVLVVSTHTHAGPDVLGLWTPAGRGRDESYLAAVREAAAEAVAEAWAARRPARLAVASVPLPHLVRDTRLPEVIDPTAVLVRADAADESGAIAVFLIFASHPEALGRENTRISSDYPGPARRALEEAFGGVAIFASGAIGGLLTPPSGPVADPATGAPLPRTDPRVPEIVGRTLAEAVIAAARGGAGMTASLPAAGRIEVRRRVLRVPLENPRFVAGLREGRIWRRPPGADGTLQSEVAVVTLHGRPGTAPVAQFACVPGEIYPELVLGGIQDPQDPGADFQGAPRETPLFALLRAPHRAVLGLCNDELGYIIPRSQWDESPPYAYGRPRAQYGEINSAGPGVAPVVAEAFARLLAE
jgi:hypothetical protein